MVEMKVLGKLSIGINNVIDQLPCGSKEDVRQKIIAIIDEMSYDYKILLIDSWTIKWLDREVE